MMLQPLHPLLTSLMHQAKMMQREGSVFGDGKGLRMALKKRVVLLSRWSLINQATKTRLQSLYPFLTSLTHRAKMMQREESVFGDGFISRWWERFQNDLKKRAVLSSRSSLINQATKMRLQSFTPESQQSGEPYSTAHPAEMSQLQHAVLAKLVVFAQVGHVSPMSSTWCRVQVNLTAGWMEVDQ